MPRIYQQYPYFYNANCTPCIGIYFDYFLFLLPFLMILIILIIWLIYDYPRIKSRSQKYIIMALVRDSAKSISIKYGANYDYHKLMLLTSFLRLFTVFTPKRLDKVLYKCYN
jgi:hypothetical protein